MIERRVLSFFGLWQWEKKKNQSPPLRIFTQQVGPSERSDESASLEKPHISVGGCRVLLGAAPSSTKESRLSFAG